MKNKYSIKTRSAFRNFRIPFNAGVYYSITVLLFSFFLTACQSDTNPVLETDEKQYQRGLSLLKQAREREALDAFEKVIKKREKAPQSYLEAGKLYLQLMREPVTARYYFTQYLKHEPNSPESPIVRELIRTAEKDFLKTLPGKPFRNGVTNFELQKQNKEILSQNNSLQEELEKAARIIGKLKEDIAILQQQIQPAASKPRSIPASPKLVDPAFAHNHRSQAYNANNKPVSSNSSTTQRMTTYKVRSGDTLSKISERVYGSKNYYKVIYQANIDQMKSENDLRVGQVLRIPIPRNR